MRAYPEQLAQTLSKGLHLSYLLFGNEPLIKQDAIKNVQDAALKQGFDETHRFTVDTQFRWQDIYDTCQGLSLFARRQVLILSLPETPINATLTNALKELSPLLHQDVLLIVEGPKLTKAQESAKWFTSFESNGLYIPCNTPDPRHLPRFIQARCKALNLKPDQSSVLMLAKWYEGNLLALSQSLMMLALLFPDGTLTLIRLEDALSRQNHYTPFQLTDALIEGKPKRAMRIVQQLEAEGGEITLLLRTIQKELVQLCKMQEYLATGAGMRQMFDNFHVWQARRAPIEAALQRLSMKKLRFLLGQLCDLEIMVKSDHESQPWSSLRAFCIDIC